MVFAEAMNVWISIITFLLLFTSATHGQISLCSTNPCINGGNCTFNSNDSSIFCSCPEGFSGVICQIPDVFDPCESDPCQNNGICESFLGSDNFSCGCSEGFTGELCEIMENGVEELNPCSSNPCLNGGSCVMLNFNYLDELESGFDNYICICTLAYFGQNCEEILNSTPSVVDPCLSNPCMNGGSCISDLIGTPTCQCTEQYTGLMCEVEVAEGFDPCSPNPCQNGGSCSVTNFNYEDYLGSGSLLTPVTNHACVCTSSYFGPNCEEIIEPTPRSIDPCLSNPCMNGGSCISDLIGTPTCQCTEQYTGQMCEVEEPPTTTEFDIIRTMSSREEEATSFSLTTTVRPSRIDPCLSNPCMNGGSCISDLIGTPTCQCNEQYTGLMCEFEVAEGFDPCSPNPCQNGGSCFVTNFNYEDYLGSGSLLTPVTNHACVCTSSYFGPNCEEIIEPTPRSIDPCLSNPCMNGGSCISDLIGTPTCQCTEQYTGQMCEVEEPPTTTEFDIIRTMSSREEEATSFSLTTTVRPSRIVTEEFDPCSSNPCQNGASCVVPFPNNIYALGSSIDDYICFCASPYSGPNCDEIQEPTPGVVMDNCSSNPCLNGGTCSLDYVNGYNCVCSNQYQGTNCETPKEKERCPFRPCLNGHCIASWYGSKRCLCRYGYTGTSCERRVVRCRLYCYNGGTCSKLLGLFDVCSCRNGYSGKYCQYRNSLFSIYGRTSSCLIRSCSPGFQCRKLGFFNYKCVPCNWWNLNHCLGRPIPFSFH